MRPDDDWLLLREAHLNVVIEGEESRVAETIVALTPHLLTKVQSWVPGSMLALPEGTQGTLILPNVERLTANDQARLLEWLRSSQPRRVQVVSTTSANLYRLVCDAVFNRDLYYYLNTLRIDLW